MFFRNRPITICAIAKHGINAGQTNRFDESATGTVNIRNSTHSAATNRPILTMTYFKRLIEVDLLIKRTSAHARREKSIRHGHISTNRQPTHPGAVLREDVIPAMQIQVSELARQMHVSRQTIHNILNETKPVTPNIALRLGRLIGNGPNIWLRMQEAYDLWQVEQKIASELNTIKRYKAA